MLLALIQLAYEKPWGQQKESTILKLLTTMAWREFLLATDFPLEVWIMDIANLP